MGNSKIKNYLNTIEAVIENGEYKDNWASLSKYPEAQWYKDAKFGIFIHWGVYSVPAFGNEWYPRKMYLEGSDTYEHHIKTYGPHKDFGYKDFIPMFKAEKFDAKAWIDLFKRAGAKYVMPVAEHHDGFQMYDSDLSEFCASKMGPMRDVCGELRDECEKQGLVFSASSHRAENYWFFGGSRKFDSGVQEIEFEEPYGFATPYFIESNKASHDINTPGASTEHLEDWLVRTCEIIDKYQPKVVWFDWWIHNMTFKPYIKKLAAYYYNRANEWGAQVAINYKYDAYALSSAIFDVERGQLSDIRPRLWQTDTAVAKNSWGYTENNDFKLAEDIVGDLIDIVSKNGCMLLNVGPKADGTITDEDTAILEDIGKWLAANGEGIYDTTFWAIFGEGPTEVKEGAFTDVNRSKFTDQDIRFTYNAPYIYAHILNWTPTSKAKIKSLKNDAKYFNGHIENVELLGYDNKVSFTRDDEALSIEIDGSIDTKFPICFKIMID